MNDWKLSGAAAMTALAVLFAGACSTAPKVAKQAEFMDRARSITAWFEHSVPDLRKQIDASGGYVIFPDITQWGILFSGGSFGRGALCEPDGKQIGWAAINVGSVGLQAGVQGFRMLLVLQDAATLAKFKANQLTGNASGVLVVADAAASGTAPFSGGIALYEGANKGLMAGIKVGLEYIRYQPLAPDEAPGDTR